VSSQPRPPHGTAPCTPRPTERRAAAAPPSRLLDGVLFVIANRGQSLFTDRDLRGPLPLIANRGQSLFTDRDLRGPLPVIANHGQSLFTDRDLRGPLPLIVNHGQSLFTRFGRGPHLAHHAQEFMTATST
jgi:hypothetical protein